MKSTEPLKPAGESKPSFEDRPMLSFTVAPGVNIESQGLVLIVGPNSAGKTQLLKDIHAVLNGQVRELVVCTQVSINKPPELEALLQGLCTKGFLKQTHHPNGTLYVQQAAPPLGGAGYRAHNQVINQVRHWHETWKSQSLSGRVDVNPFLESLNSQTDCEQVKFYAAASFSSV
jgi:ABC-type cobalamin/Fe3+-siderophores transport system ATPase subunit